MDLAAFAKSKGFDADLLTRFGVRADFDRIEVPYYDAQGNELPRFQVSYENGGGWRWNRGNGQVTPYGLQRPVPYDQSVVIVEGASDCWALWSAGIPALGIPGATATGCLHADQVPVPEVVIVEEPDDAGARFPARVGRRLRETGFAGVLSVLKLGTYKDPRDALIGESSRFPAFFSGVFKGRVRLPEAKAGTLGPAVVSGTQFLGAQSALPYLIDGLLPVGGSMLIAAAKKVGKSVTQLNLAKAVARGEPFLGRATRAGRVLYVSLDEPQSITRARATALGITGDDAIDWVLDRRVPDQWVRWLRDLCTRTSYALIVIDTLAKLTGVQEINSYGEWNRKLAPLHGLAEEFTITWEGAVHTRKNDGEASGANDVAGSMALTAGVDTILIERRQAAGVRTLESEQRDGADLETSTLIMDRETFALSLGPSQAAQREAEVDTKVLGALQNGPLRSPALMDRCSVRRGDFWASIERLLRGGYITRAGLAGYALAITPTTLEEYVERGVLTQEQVDEARHDHAIIPEGPARSPEVPTFREDPCLFFIGAAKFAPVPKVRRTSGGTRLGHRLQSCGGAFGGFTAAPFTLPNANAPVAGLPYRGV